MGKGILCLLVLGLTQLLAAAELGLENVSPTELKEIEAEIAKGNVPPDVQLSEKSKRGVSKLATSDGTSFNQVATSSTSSSSGVKSPVGSVQPPYRYLYSSNNNNNNNQYYQTNPYVSYVQSQQAVPLSATFPQTGVTTHFLQTPTQVQYVSTPGRYQTKVANQVYLAPQASTTLYQAPATAAQYHAPAAATTTTTTTTAAAAAAAAAAAQYQVPQQLYYQQQPIVMLLVQPQPHPLLYAGQGQQQVAYVLGQQPLLNLFGGHRFSVPFAGNGQVTYLVPMAIQTAPQAVQSGPGKTAVLDKAPAQTTSGASYGIRTNKA